LAAVTGLVMYFQSLDFDVECPGPGEAAVVACGEGPPPSYEPEDPETVQFADATDLTADAAPFTSNDGYLSIAAPGVWVPDLEPEGWTPIAAADLVNARFGFESDGAEVVCYEAEHRTIAFADFLDDEGVFSAIAVAQRALYDEASVYERTTEPVYEHYSIDGNAVLAAEAEYTWTTAVDPDTGDITEGEWTERWGFVAVYRGGAGAAICSYGGQSDAEALQGLQDHLLGLRLSR
jgi:hypothetical protein